MKNVENSETPIDNNVSESFYIPVKKKFNKILAEKKKDILYDICVIFGVIAIIFFLWCLNSGGYEYSNSYNKPIVFKKIPDVTKSLEKFQEKPLLTSYDNDINDIEAIQLEQVYYNDFLDEPKDRLKRDALNIPQKINEIEMETEINEKQRKPNIKTKGSICKARLEFCKNVIKSINSQARTASDAIESLKQMIGTMKPNSRNPSTQELYECLVCERARKSDIKKMDGGGSGSSHPHKYPGGLERSRGQNVNHVVNVYTNDKPIEDVSKVELSPSNGDIQTTVLVSKSNTSKIQDGTKIIQVIRNKTIVERRSDNTDEIEQSNVNMPIKFYFPLTKNQLSGTKNHYNTYNQENMLNRMTTRDTTSYLDSRQKDQNRNNFNANNPPIYQPNSRILPGIQMPQQELNSQNLGSAPTAENTISRQQLVLTPFVMPICYSGFVSPVQPPRKTDQVFFPSETVVYSYPQPNGVFPMDSAPFGSIDPYQKPFSNSYQPPIYQGYPGISSPVNSFGDQRVGPTGPGNIHPGYGFPRASSPPMYPCSYVSMPTYQFPQVPGITDLQRMNDPSSSFRNNEGQQFDQIPFTGSAWRENSNSTEKDLHQDCKPNYFKCLDSSLCIPIFHRCDGNVDCTDASDEHTCSCKDRITKDKLCDGYFDCPKGEDELGCFGCGEDSFSCQDWTKRNPHGSCVQLSERCDGVRHCRNSKDETDCSILTQSFVENQDLFTIGYSSGYLFKNWHGKWYPVCSPTMAWAIESCAAEVGTSSKQTPKVTVETIVRNNDQNSYITMKSSGQIEIVSECSNKVVFVECPPIPCGTRVLVKQDNFKPYGVYEDTLVASQRVENTTIHVVSNNTDHNTSNVVQLGNVDGRSSMGSRIVGGRASQPQAWPFLVAIYRDGYFRCGGVIVNEQWILTAAHCVERHEKHYYQVLAGLLRRFSFSPMAQARQAKSIIPHYDYNRDKMTNDLALVRLDESLRFNRWIRAACLPQPQWGNQPTAEEKCTTVGWGATVEHGPDPDHLREVEVPILEKCKHPTDHYEGVVCAGWLNGGKDACQGDSGGPLMCKVEKTNTQWYVAGVVSYGEGCARPNEPGVYTRVSYYSHWINNTMNLDHTPLGSKPLKSCPGFKCNGDLGKCLPSYRRCDKDVDCLDAEDEINCENVNKDISSSFRESLNQPTNKQKPATVGSAQDEMNNPESAHGSNNDATMEINYDEESTTLEINEAITETTESTTEAITEDSEIFVTPQIITTTELYPNVSSQFSCSRLTQTISMTGRCDKIIDCEDGTDEADCSCKDFLIKLHPSSICDGRIDCVDESDEIDCDFCKKDEFTCIQSGTCIPQSKRCDKINDCPLKEDELDCYALTDGTYIGTDFHKYPSFKYKGIVTNFTNDEWKPVCYDIYDTDLNNRNYLDSFCQHLGLTEHKMSNLRQVTDLPLKIELKLRHANDFVDESALQVTNSETNKDKLCYGLNIECELTFNRSIETFTVKNNVYQNQSYLWPWEAAIFVDGHYHCPAVLLNYNWALSSSICTKNIDLRTNFTVILAGLSIPYKYVDGPNQQITQVKHIENLDPLQVSMLHIDLKQTSRYIQPVFFDRRFYPATLNDECVAIGTDRKMNTKMTFLQTVLDECPPCHRCFKNKIIEECRKNETAEDWSGTVTCRGPNGWYPAAVFHEKDIFCEFQIVQSLTSIDYMYAYLMESMQDSLYIPLDSPPCEGKRCSLGNCVTWDKVCDGIQDCRDGSDENTKACNEKQDICEYSNEIQCECALSELRCRNGLCIPKENYCNGFADCPDGSDEPADCNCAGYLELSHPERLCNNIRNCYDKSDENHEKCLCEDASFKCINSTSYDGEISCISQDFVCDGDKDCPNGEDETLCRTVRGSLKDPQGTGEVLRRGYGVWYSECFSAPVETDSEAEILCKSMGYSNGTILTPEESSNYGPANKPVRDNFYIISFNTLMYTALRDNKPLVSLVSDSENCHRAFVRCL